jgi:hypothetical protein
MLKLFLMLSGFVRRFPGNDWRRDPLSHPDIARMDARMLGDLPIDSRAILPE